MESNATLSAALPAAPPAPYLGGKRNLARRLVALIGRTSHTTYVEPFVGMGGVFLRRPFRAKAEVINDISTDVTNLFRILRHHYVPLMDLLRWQVTSRDEFERLLAMRADSLTDLQRAARFLYLQRTAFGGKISDRNFGVSLTTPARFDVTKLAPLLAEVHERLAGVVIERLPYADLIRRYDSPGTLFYLDPPYWNCEGDYGAGVFGRADFQHLADLLADIRGTFIMSLNDTAGVRETFARFQIEAVETTWSISRDGPQKRGEVIITPQTTNGP